MDSGFNRKLKLGYGFSIVMLLVVGCLSYLTVGALLRSNAAVEHSNIIIQKLEKALSLMKDAETGQRGYLLTGKETFLEPYRGAPTSALALVDETLVLTRDNAAQQESITAIRVILVKRMGILQAMIEKRKRGEQISENDLDAGKAAMDDLRQAADKAEANEEVLLNERATILNRYSSITPIISITAIVLAMLFTAYSYLQITRDIREKDRLRAEIEGQEVETASLNEELTAANEEITAANEELTAINEELVEAREELESLNDNLELKIAERTKALADSEEETAALNEELMAANEEITATNEELAATNEELMATNEELSESQAALQKAFNELFVAKGQIEKSEKLFSAIAKNIPGSFILVIDTDQRILTAEGDSMEVFGFHHGEVLGKLVAEAAMEGRYEASKHLFDRMLDGQLVRAEVKGPNGADYQVDMVPLYNDTQEIYAGLIIVLDITDIKKAEERSAKLAAIVDSSDDAIIGKSLDGVITSWNRGAQRMFGYGEGDMVGSSILKLIPEDRQEEEPLIISRLREGEHVDHYETQRLTIDGKLIDVSLTISPIRDSAGRITGISKIARDISEQKRDEQRKNDFIGMASHELKTPLTSLSALIQVLNMKLRNAEDAFVPSALEKATTQVRKMTGMINGFLNISRLESGKLQIDRQPFELNALIEEMIGEMKLVVTSHTLEFNPGEMIMVNADRDKIGSVISNLLSNAVKYSPRGKAVSINTEIHGSIIQLSVKDEGMGIKPADMPNLFERYYRVTSEHTRNISGFGIGLYLSAEIVQRHNGRIWADSEKGIGSTFYFTLPLA